MSLFDMSDSLGLLPGEAIDFRGEDLHHLVASDADINEKYVTGEVRIVTEQARYPLNTIAGLVSSTSYKLNPEFQRRHRWSREKQSRLIESFIMNVPVPPIFLYEDEYSHYEVMDGLQRLTAIAAFYENDLRLEGLAEWPELNGKSYKELPEQVRRGVDRRYLSSIILLRETAKTSVEAERLKQLVFERINSGGERLEDQESRNAIFNGPMNSLCIRLSRNPHLCRTWDIPEPDEHELLTGEVSADVTANARFRKMADVELVLRFFAHRQRRRLGIGALNQYLDEFLKNANLFAPPLLDALGTLFEDTVALAYDVLGEGAFWLYRFRHNNWGWLERPTTTAYDAIMHIFSLNLDRASEMRARASEFKAALPHFYKANAEKFDARMTNLSNLRERDTLVQDFVNQVLASGQYIPRES